MFRLYYLDAEGQTNGVVRQDDTEGLDGADFACNHATTARARATEAAIRSEADVLVARLVDGKPKPAYVIQPDGRRKPPAGSTIPKEAACTATTSDRPCFCVICRAERRAAR